MIWFLLCVWEILLCFFDSNDMNIFHWIWTKYQMKNNLNFDQSPYFILFIFIFILIFLIIFFLINNIVLSFQSSIFTDFLSPLNYKIRKTFYVQKIYNLFLRQKFSCFCSTGFWFRSVFFYQKKKKKQKKQNEKFVFCYGSL